MITQKLTHLQCVDMFYVGFSSYTISFEFVKVLNRSRLIFSQFSGTNRPYRITRISNIQVIVYMHASETAAYFSKTFLQYLRTLLMQLRFQIFFVEA